MDLHLALCNFIAPKRAIKFCYCISLVDPFAVDCIVFDKNTPTISPASFMISMASRDVFGGFTFAAFNTYNIPAVVAVMINPYLIESSMFFSNHSYSVIVYFF